MKVSQIPSKFEPVTLVLEVPEEVVALIKVIRDYRMQAAMDTYSYSVAVALERHLERIKL